MNIYLGKTIFVPSDKISKTVGLIAKLRLIVPTRTPFDICKSLIAPCIMHGLISWGNDP